ncbi:hypothetical protein DND132_1179 [Pseudodesulfovibrio mercurii]|uniref:Uncharacterized protein n=1 Tax=Pseudodesulfovibrio mercurii TaxID=641491 RepID=F0JBZ8_9BACT|nr:hypothetical protein [Pseudodesulfovibrio mercurii]EGB14391.1 hypothetical protein DND132_1179 [Pseudodesulfovibrio mercurii]
MKFTFLVTLDGIEQLEVQADIARLTVEFRGRKPAADFVCRRTAYHCDRCREVDAEGRETGTCRAVLNIFELCRYFVNTKSIDMVEMTAIHNDRCRVTSRRRADDALVEMMLVIIAASGCARFGRLRWAWDYWNYESDLDHLFYNLFSAFLVLESLTGDGRDSLNKAIGHVHAKIDKVQQFVGATIDQVREDYTAVRADAASTALATIWAIGDIFRLQTSDRLDRLRERILATQP